jgi:hypothetical protein
MVSSETSFLRCRVFVYPQLPHPTPGEDHRGVLEPQALKAEIGPEKMFSPTFGETKQNRRPVS